MDEERARALANAYLHTRLRRNRLWLLAALVVFAGGIALQAWLSGPSDWLAKHGVHGEATVVDTALGRRFFTEHIDVRVVTHGRPAPIGRIYVGENDDYAVGQRIEVVYDPNDPSRVRLPHDDNLPPLEAIPAFALIFALFILPWVWFKLRRVIRHAERAVEGTPEREQVFSSVVPYGAWSRRVMEAGGRRFWTMTKKGWNLPPGAHEALVFRTGKARVAVDVDSRSVAAEGYSARYSPYGAD